MTKALLLHPDALQPGRYPLPGFEFAPEGNLLAEAVEVVTDGELATVVRLDLELRGSEFRARVRLDPAGYPPADLTRLLALPPFLLPPRVVSAARDAARKGERPAVRHVVARKSSRGESPAFLPSAAGLAEAAELIRRGCPACMATAADVAVLVDALRG